MILTIIVIINYLGQYPISQEDALYLAALHFLNKFPEYLPLRHRIGFLGE
jgi:hypothetical protein